LFFGEKQCLAAEKMFETVNTLCERFKHCFTGKNNVGREKTMKKRSAALKGVLGLFEICPLGRKEGSR